MIIGVLGSKPCSRCKQTLPASDFHSSKKHSTGLWPSCKLCTAALKKASEERVKQKDPEQWKNRRKTYRERYKANNPDAVRQSDKRASLKKKFGMTETEYHGMLSSQGGRCACCKREPVGRSLAVDHCHSTGKIRGLLCTNCNTALGLLGDSPTTIESLLGYIKTHLEES